MKLSVADGRHSGLSEELKKWNKGTVEKKNFEWVSEARALHNHNNATQLSFRLWGIPHKKNIKEKQTKDTNRKTLKEKRGRY